VVKEKNENVALLEREAKLLTSQLKESMEGKLNSEKESRLLQQHMGSLMSEIEMLEEEKARMIEWEKVRTQESEENAKGYAKGMKELNECVEKQTKTMAQQQKEKNEEVKKLISLIESLESQLDYERRRVKQSEENMQKMVRENERGKKDMQDMKAMLAEAKKTIAKNVDRRLKETRERSRERRMDYKSRSSSFSPSSSLGRYNVDYGKSPGQKRILRNNYNLCEGEGNMELSLSPQSNNIYPNYAGSNGNNNYYTNINDINNVPSFRSKQVHSAVVHSLPESLYRYSTPSPSPEEEEEEEEINANENGHRNSSPSLSSLPSSSSSTSSSSSSSSAFSSSLSEPTAADINAITDEINRLQSRILASFKSNT
jgi:hypothetical protein